MELVRPRFFPSSIFVTRAGGGPLFFCVAEEPRVGMVVGIDGTLCFYFSILGLFLACAPTPPSFYRPLFAYLCPILAYGAATFLREDEP